MATSLTSAPNGIGVSGAETDWVGFALEGFAEAESCFSGFVLSWSCWGASVAAVLRSVWLKSCVDLFIDSFSAIEGVL